MFFVFLWFKVQGVRPGCFTGTDTSFPALTTGESLRLIFRGITSLDAPGDFSVVSNPLWT